MRRIQRLLLIFSILWIAMGCSTEETPNLIDGSLRPPTLVGTYDAGVITLTWTEGVDSFEGSRGQVDTEEYVLEQSSTSADELELLRSVDASQRQFIVEELNNGQAYYFAVRAAAKGQSVRSNVIMVIPQAPPAFTEPTLPDSIQLDAAWSQQATDYARQLWPSNALPVFNASMLDPVILDSIQYDGGGKFQWSPVGGFLLYEQSIALSNGLLWGYLGIYHTGMGRVYPLTYTDQFFYHQATWSKDGMWIAYLSDELGGNEYNIWKVRADGSERQALSDDQGDLNELVSPSLRSPSALCFSPSGDFLAFERQQPLGDGYVYNLYEIASSGGSFNELLRSHWNDRKPSYSPLGDQIAFISDRSGQPEIWLMDKQQAELQQISGGEGMPSPLLQAGLAWSWDGTELLYLSAAGGRIVTVTLP